MYDKLIRFILFQLTWWLLVLSPKVERLLGWPGASDTLAFLISMGSMALIFRNQARHRVLLIVLGFVGFTLDSASTNLGLFYASIPNFTFAPEFQIAPWWLLALWLAFIAALTATVSLSTEVYLRSRKNLIRVGLIAAALGGLFGPISYFAGEPLGILEFGEKRILALTWLAVEWAILFPVLLFLTAQGKKKPTLGESAGIKENRKA